MLQRVFNKIVVIAILTACAGFAASAQTYGSYTPYSLYGIGDLHMQGTAYNKSMGGVGIANRSMRYVNYLNPAAITERDSLSFMADVSLYQDNKYFRQGDMKSVSNTFNIGDLVMTFPITSRNTAFMVGIAPYSGTGFGYKYNYDDPSVIGKTGNITYMASGQGALYQAFAGAGVTFFNRLSIGAEAIYYFGKTEKTYAGSFSDSTFNGFENGYTMSLTSLSGKFGIQYEQPIGSGELCVGATYTMGSDLKGYLDSYRFSSGAVVSDTLSFKSDTLAKTPGRLKLANEIGVGISYRYADKWMVEFDYTRSDWRNSGFDKVQGFMGNATSSSGFSSFGASVSQAFRVGFEYVPNRNDSRYYFNTVSYRAGAYYKDDYFTIDGHKVNSMGITIGATFPVFRWFNGITFTVDIGQRGTTANNLIKEKYVNFSLGVNIFDIWFQKLQYD